MAPIPQSHKPDALPVAYAKRVTSNVEEHVVLTKGGYLLGIHRIPCPICKSRPVSGISTGKPVIYLHNGLLMNSEVWVCVTNPERFVPFVLAELGYDVWLGNNCGNNYSKKSIRYDPNSSKFWDFSIDDFAWHDIPDSIECILQITCAHSSQLRWFQSGDFPSVCRFEHSPSAEPKGQRLHYPCTRNAPKGSFWRSHEGLMSLPPLFLPGPRVHLRAFDDRPTLLFLIFGRRAILSSALFWQSILYPPIFARLVDTSLVVFLFLWHSHNITFMQKLAAYPLFLR